MIRPGHCLGASALQHPLADRIDQARLFGNRNKLQRGNLAAQWVIPAQQGFASYNCLRLKLDERLIVKLEFAIRHRRTQICFQPAPLLHAGVHFRREIPVVRATLGLGAVQRQIGVLHEFVQAYRLPEPIEQVSAWLFRVARNRIIDRFRKKKEQPLSEMAGTHDNADTIDDEYRLDLALPSEDGGPEAAYARSVLLAALQNAIDELPENQRDIFMAHEIEGRSFKELASESGVALNTLLARKRYAVLHLRARLQAVYDELDI